MPIRLRESEIALILERVKYHRSQKRGLMESCHRAEADTGIPATTIYWWVRKMRSTTELASEYLRSQAMKLAVRVVRKANVEQAMNILSRPNIGVLDPQGDGGGGGGRQFVVGVAMDSLGSVRVGVQIGSGEQRATGGAGGAETRLIDGEVSEEGGEEALEDAGAGGGEPGEEGGEAEEFSHPTPRRGRWLRPDPKRTETIAPVPVEAGRTIGQSLEMRLATAKAQRKADVKARRKEKEAVSKRAEELKQQLALARKLHP